MRRGRRLNYLVALFVFLWLSISVYIFDFHLPYSDQDTHKHVQHIVHPQSRSNSYFEPFRGLGDTVQHASSFRTSGPPIKWHKVMKTSNSVGDNVLNPFARSTPSSSTLVVYSGPTTLRDELYLDNFEYFLSYGLPSSFHGCNLNVAVYIVLTEATLAYYSDAISHQNGSCGDIHVVTRKDRCYDLESAREVLINLRVSFDKLVFLNCGLRGPFLPPREGHFWAFTFTAMIDSRVKLSGITINCGGKLGVEHPHVQSMLWSTDREGLSIIIESGAIYDCGDQLQGSHGRDQLIVDYEMGLSRAVMLAGYAIRDLTNRKYTWSDSNARCHDLWDNDKLIDKYSPDRLVFWKVSRKGQLEALLGRITHRTS